MACLVLTVVFNASLHPLHLGGGGLRCLVAHTVSCNVLHVMLLPILKKKTNTPSTNASASCGELGKDKNNVRHEVEK